MDIVDITKDWNSEAEDWIKKFSHNMVVKDKNEYIIKICRACVVKHVSE
jgi:hypothetical protein